MEGLIIPICMLLIVVGGAIAAARLR